MKNTTKTPDETPDSERRRVRLAIQLTDEEYKHFARLAVENHLPMATYVRAVIMAIPTKQHG